MGGRNTSDECCDRNRNPLRCRHGHSPLPSGNSADGMVPANAVQMPLNVGSINRGTPLLMLAAESVMRAIRYAAFSFCHDARDSDSIRISTFRGFSRKAA